MKWKEPLLPMAVIVYFVSSLSFMAAMSMSVFLLLLLMIAEWRNPEKKAIAFSHLMSKSFRVYWYMAALLFLSCLISLVGALINPLTFGFEKIRVNLFLDLAKGWYLFWPPFLAVILLGLNDRQRENVIRGWLGAFYFFSLLGVLQFFTGWIRPQPIPGEKFFHATVFLGHHLSVASIFIFPWFVNLELWRQKSKLLPQWLYYFGAIIGTSCLLMTYSRTLWVALPIGFLLWLFWYLSKKIAVIAILVSLFGFFILSNWGPIQYRLRDAYGLVTRKELWKANWEFFKARPLTGVGWRHNHELVGHYFLSKNPKAQYFGGHAHNNFLDILSGTGILGVLGFSFWNLWVILQLWGFLKRPISLATAFPGALFFAWVVFHLNGLTQLNFWEGKVQHQMMMMVAFSLLWKRKRDMSLVDTNQNYRVVRVVIDARFVGKIKHGVSRYTENLAVGLAQWYGQNPISYEVIFLIGKETPKGSFGNFTTVRLNSKYLGIWEQFEIPWRLFRLKADLYHSPTFSSLLFSPCPWVLTVHDLNHLQYGCFLKKFYYHAILKRFARRARALITISNFSRTEISKWLHVKQEKLHLVKNAILEIEGDQSEKVLESISSKFKNYRRYLGNYFLCVTHDKPHKNVSFLISAYDSYASMLPAGIIPWPLVITIEAIPEIHQILKHPQYVFCVNGCEENELKWLLQNAGCLVFPSLYEGFGLPPLEALAQGVPVLVSSIDSIREAIGEILQSDSSYVLWADPKDHEKWVHSLNDVHFGKLHRPTPEIQDLVFEKYSTRTLGQKMDRIYKDVLGLSE